MTRISRSRQDELLRAMEEQHGVRLSSGPDDQPVGCICSHGFHATTPDGGGCFGPCPCPGYFLDKDTMDAACQRSQRYAMGKERPHGFEYGPGGSPYCGVCGATAEGFYHRSARP